jgi:hypothetical protein
MMASTIRATADCIKDRKQRRQWALALWKQAQGDGKYFGHRYRVATNPILPALARLAGQRMPPEAELVKPLLERLAAELKMSVAGDRDVKDCRLLAAKIKATGDCLKAPEQKRQWFEGLAKIIEGKETFKPRTAKKNAKAVRDPCADTINRILLPLRENSRTQEK